ncbi:hypothetical protein BDN72DRAFT_789560 [Pluteus cervinus]|uniref:Uncharacterized protein n=1 Tax=Pluteus cervinus TaxID=181527 RepID=A0ACD3B7K9_9AGAR|nr:hypothetical protein BDN72DRAFT_789560 [Pluteus cervinus]
MGDTLPDLKDIAGPRLIGYMLNSVLYGSLGVQVYFYYEAFPKDRRAIKCLVYTIFLLETLQTIMFFRDCFVVFTKGLGNPSEVNTTQLCWFAVAILDGIVGCIVQIFFAYRIFVLSKSKIVPSIICIVAITQAISAVTAGIMARSTHISDTSKVSSLPICIWLSGSAICDTLIASFMTYYLSRCNSKVRQTRALISKLIRMTIETGSITASVAVVVLVMFLLGKPNFFSASITLSIILGKLYSNTTLVILNSRRNISDIDDASTSGQPLSLLNFEQDPNCNILGVLNDHESGDSGARQIKISV